MLIGGEWVWVVGFENGNFVLFMVFDDLNDDMIIVCEEIFGLVMLLFSFSDEEEVLVWVNNIFFGLVGGVFIWDIDWVYCMVDVLEVGIVWINHYNIIFIEMLFGGFK